MTRGVFFVALLMLLPAGSARADAIPHPDDPSKQVEFFTAVPEGKGPWPTIVLLHGHQAEARPGAQGYEGMLTRFSTRGVLGVAVSQPGYGHSSGPPDFCGPSSWRAVAGVIAKLRGDGVIAPGKLVVQGVSRGAVVAAMVAAHDPDVAGLILIAGEYDLAALAADSTVTGVSAVIRQNLINESGGTTEALRARTVLNFAKDIKAATLIVHGEKDDRSSPENARRLADAMTQSGGTVRLAIIPATEHSVPPDVRRKETDPFLASLWGELVWPAKGN